MRSSLIGESQANFLCYGRARKPVTAISENATKDFIWNAGATTPISFCSGRKTGILPEPAQC
jgi:hypothetical protein